MSEKITFGELIESIAEETNNSKQFTHDFLKDFVDVINSGLEDDGNVNIAGFGKFELRRMDEREGYNPQTEEKITIPAHNKVVFKPYKDLRELVNAPYAHLEPELIEEKTTTEEESEDTEASDQDDFIPTGPPTSHQEIEDQAEEDTESEEIPFDLDDEISPVSGQESEDEKESEDEVESTEEYPFNLEDDSGESEEREDDEDIVEFSADDTTQEQEETKEESFSVDDFISSIEPSDPEEAETSDEQAEGFQDKIEGSEEKEQPSEQNIAEEQEYSESLAQSIENESDEENEASDEDLDDFIGSSEQSTKEATTGEEEAVEEEIVSDDFSATDEESDDAQQSPFAPDIEDTTEEQEEERTQTPSFVSKRQSRNRTSSLPILAAAAVVLLLVAAGAWYFTSSSSNSSPQMATSETTATSNVAAQQNNQQEPSTNDQAQPKQPAKPNQNQSQKSSGTAKATVQQTTNDENLKIQKGQTLWSIAEEKYGNPRLWPWIYGNNGSLENPNLILAGNSLSVPLPSGPQNTLNAADSVGVAKGFLSTYRWYKDNQASIAKNHLWAAKSYHDNIRNITDIEIDKADLAYANQAR